MSKWLVPPQDWDKVTKQPLTTRVHGVKGDEQARVIAQQYAGPISHFLQAQTQQRAASGLDVYKTRQQLPDLQLSYAYIHGQEYLDIRVAAHVAERLGGVEDFWDFALVELAVPSIYTAKRGNRFVCYAHLTSPTEDILTPDSEWPANGVASNDRTRMTKDPIINAADSASTFVPITVSGDPGIASFTVDLRQSRGGVVTLDLYPYLFVSDEIIPIGVIQWASNGVRIESHRGYPDEPDVMPPVPSADPENWTDPPIFVTPIPTMHFDHSSNQWVFDDSGTNGTITDIGYFYDGWVMPFTATNPSPNPLYMPGQRSNADMYDPSFAPNSWDHTHNWWYWHFFQTTPYIPAYSGPHDVPAKLEVSLFKGVPPFEPLRDNAKQFRRWGDQSARAFAPKTVIETTVPAFSNSTFPVTGKPQRLDDFYNIPLKGKVTLDTHRLIRGRPEIIENVTFNQA